MPQVQQEQEAIVDDWSTWTAPARKTLKDKKKKRKAAMKDIDSAPLLPAEQEE